MATLQEIRAKLAAQEQRSSSGQTRQFDNSIYPHWNLENSKESRIRVLPDGDKSNTFFWVEKQMIKLPFAGIKGEVDSKPLVVQVPCMEMYNDTCPVLAEVRGWFKDKSLEELGRKYWKKRSYILQGFVVEDGLNEESKPENPIRRFQFTNQLYTLIKNGLFDPEIDEMVTDYVHGLDFRIIQGSKGGFNDYGGSVWTRRERPLSNQESAAIDQYKLFNLKEFLPKKPNDAELKAIVEMFHASVDGEAYDKDAWGQFYKPYGLEISDTKPADTNTPASHDSTPVSQSDTSDDLPFDTTASVSVLPTAASSDVGSAKAADILAKIRNRQPQ